MFIVESAQSGGHHCALAEISKGSAMVGAIDHGQASNIKAQPCRGRFGDKLVGMSHDQSARARFQNNPLAPRGILF
jgi:hypothetical protein